MPVLQNNPKFESSRASTPTHVYDLRNRDFRKKPPIGHFCKFIPKSCQEKKSQIIEVHREYKLNSTPKPRQPMYRGLYIDELLSYTQHHPVSSNLSPETFFITTDRQFSVRTVVDSDGNIVEERNYSPMGIDLEGNAETSDLSYGFTGRRYDSESGLYYFRARYYSTELGQFISRDPLEYVDGMNMYSGYFAFYMGVDPLGRFTTVPGSGPGYGGGGSSGSGGNGFDWSAISQSFILNNLTTSLTYSGGFSIVFPPAGFIDVGIGVTGKAFKCMKDGKVRRMVEIAGTVSVFGGVGAGLKSKKYPTPKGRDRNKRDPKTGEKLKHLAGKDLPWRDQVEKNRGKLSGGPELESGGCPICPAEGEGGSISVGIRGTATALIVSGKIESKLSWDWGDPFTWNNIKGSTGTSIEAGFGLEAKLGVFGSGKITWTFFIDD